MSSSLFTEHINHTQQVIIETVVPNFQVKFNDDAIDETDLLEAALRPRIESINGRIEKITLYGTHITPCLQVMLMEFS